MAGQPIPQLKDLAFTVVYASKKDELAATQGAAA